MEKNKNTHRMQSSSPFSMVGTKRGHIFVFILLFLFFLNNFFIGPSKSNCNSQRLNLIRGTLICSIFFIKTTACVLSGKAKIKKVFCWCVLSTPLLLTKKYVGPSGGLTSYPSLQSLDSAARSISNREDDKTQFSTALKTILSKLSKLVGNWLAKLTPHQCGVVSCFHIGFPGEVL